MTLEQVKGYLHKQTVGFTLSKAFLIVSNIVTLIVSMLFIAGGGYIISNGQDDITGLTNGLGVGTIIVGIIQALFSFIGLVGAAQEKTVLLKTFVAIYALILIAEIVIGSIAYAERNELNLEPSWNTLANNPIHNSTILMIEQNFQCCGYKDINLNAVPSNCYQVYGYSVPCQQALTHSIDESLEFIGGAGLITGLLQVLLLMVAVVVIKGINKKKNYRSF
ncbi:hypothetical protein HDV04_001662 [Boothiomyces sp. JEL0838]|nr:hypothetical protein HDV04_001662 [Boothiomyces sp. JEL0838]